LLRLNRLVDRGVAMAVVGYTDEIAASLLSRSEDERVVGRRTPDPAELNRALDQLRAELIRTISIPASAA
jgi:hypothetical protein